ncbi:ABC transporter permease [Massilia solisilvae]|uniref:ABC transporter permease n=1 Tax=Massilia solisilvae TaxID=1811225 RepID=A0ABT2BQM3_9BURK|nr:ABC transporter permease [Massilia solisilvae]MCS0610813.1 ABC transporter permease [Massilia solisilvae]
MFGYYFKLGVKSLRRNPALTALMVLTLAVGVAASMSTLTILHMMSGNPIPHKSDRLLVPVLDVGPKEGYTPGSPPDDVQATYPDVKNLLSAPVGVRRTAMYGINLAVEPARTDLPAFQQQGLAPTHDFFAMFEVPFKYGQAWTEAEDKAGADVVVLSTDLAERLFGKTNPVGKQVRMSGYSYQVVGVADHWKPLPRYYHIISGNGEYGDEEAFFLPFSTAIRHEMGHAGSMSCNVRNAKPGFAGRLEGDCTWLQFWFETASPGDRVDVQSYLDSYVKEQHRLGRMERNQPAKLYNVMEWLEERKVVGSDEKLSVWLAFGFLALCLVNTIGLLLAKFSVRAPEVGIRRALGASRREIFSQFLVETAVVGLVGGTLGLLLSYGALALMGLSTPSMKNLAHMDLEMLALTFVLSIAAAVVAGLLPTWRACQVTPALQLKSQ